MSAHLYLNNWAVMWNITAIIKYVIPGNYKSDNLSQLWILSPYKTIPWSDWLNITILSGTISN